MSMLSPPSWQLITVKPQVSPKNLWCPTSIHGQNTWSSGSYSTVSRPAAVLPGNFLEMHIIRSCLRPTGSEILGVGPAICVLTTQVLLMHIKAREQWGTPEEFLRLPEARSSIRDHWGWRHSFKGFGRKEGWKSWLFVVNQQRKQDLINAHTDYVLWLSSQLPRNSGQYGVQGFQFTLGFFSLLLECDLSLRMKHTKSGFINGHISKNMFQNTREVFCVHGQHRMTYEINFCPLRVGSILEATQDAC